MDYADNNPNNVWGFPKFENSDVIPSKLIGFNEVLSSKDCECGVHFYIDDYQFERIWNNPERYIEKLQKFECGEQYGQLANWLEELKVYRMKGENR